MSLRQSWVLAIGGSDDEDDDADDDEGEELLEDTEELSGALDDSPPLPVVPGLV